MNDTEIVDEIEKIVGNPKLWHIMKFHLIVNVLKERKK